MHQMLRIISSKRDDSETKHVVISCRGSVALDSDIITVASQLNFKNKSELVHDILEKFIDQHFRRCRPLSRMEKAQRTREIAQELRNLWCDDPEPANAQIPMARRLA
jgi:hypothetical protein